MALPRHNPLLRFVYMLSVIGMFVFMSLVIRSYWPHDAIAAEPRLTDNFSQLDVEEINPDMSSPTVAGGTVSKPDLRIISKSYMLDLNGDIEKQMNDIWQDFYQQNGLHYNEAIAAYDEVYQVYRNYDYSRSSVETLIGYRIDKALKDPEYQYVKIPAGKFLPRMSVLDSWMNYQQLPVELTFELDYEVYRLDKNYNVISQKAFLNIK